MTSLARELYNLYEKLIRVSDEARGKGYKDTDWFKHVIEAAKHVTSAITSMRMYGEIDPMEFEEIERDYQAELNIKA